MAELNSYSLFNRDNFVHLQECSHFLVGIFITFNKTKREMRSCIKAGFSYFSPNFSTQMNVS